MPNVAALLALEDGTIFHGRAFGATGTAAGEVVFNTGMAGYVEVLTDPSYRGQMVAMTYPLIGNYGVTTDDFESKKLWLSAFIVKECSRRPSNWRSTQSLPELLAAQGVIGLEGIDTRHLVRHIRQAGAMRAMVSTEILDEQKLVALAKKSPGLLGRDCVKEVTCDAAYDWNEPVSDICLKKSGDGCATAGLAPPCRTPTDAPQQRFNVVCLDYGIKYNSLRLLTSFGCRVHVVPASTTAADILARKPDGVFLSNGPGDPAALPAIVAEVKKILGRVPVFGICLGHQIIGQAVGGKTYKLKFGHHGVNQPVMYLPNRHVEITSQNHGFAVDSDSIPDSEAEVTHLNLNDHTVEGLRLKKVPALCVQYHPESGPGPHDSRYLFDLFVKMMSEKM
jgi:carbamoyl-phosphate synthase small subunit